MEREEAIKIVKSHYPANKQMLNEALEFLIPELKESEDERIRKALVRFHKSTIDVDGIKGEEIVAWLEKQGSEPNWCHHKVDLSDCSEEYRKAYYDGWNNCNMQHSQCKSELDDVVKCLINGMKFYYEENKEAIWGTDKWSMPVKHIIEVLEKQGEFGTFDVPQTPIKDAVEVTSRMQYISDDIKPIAEFIIDYANWDLHKDEWNQPTLTVPLFRVLDALIQRGKSYSECSQNIEKQGEQKSVPDWMPKFLDELRSKKNYFDWDEHKDIEGYIIAIINWINPNYFNEKDSEQKPTWSEDDERIVTALMEGFRYHQLFNPKFGEVPNAEIISWIKSLKERLS